MVLKHGSYSCRAMRSASADGSTSSSVVAMSPSTVFQRLDGMEAAGGGSWCARCDIEPESACWLLRCDGHRLTIETFPTAPGDMSCRPPAEMCVWYKSARLFMRDARGLLTEEAFAAEYVKGGIRIGIGDGECDGGSECERTECTFMPEFGGSSRRSR